MDLSSPNWVQGFTLISPPSFMLVPPLKRDNDNSRPWCKRDLTDRVAEEDERWVAVLVLRVGTCLGQDYSGGDERIRKGGIGSPGAGRRGDMSQGRVYAGSKAQIGNDAEDMRLHYAFDS